VLRRISGPKKDEIVGGWKKLHTEELRNLHSSPNIIRLITSRGVRWAGYIARMEKEKKAYRFFMGRAEGKRPLGRPRRK
jgi:hypothetical protein